MVEFFIIVATQFRCILVTVAKQIKLQKYLFSSLHFKETNNFNMFVIKENSFYSQREYILHSIKISEMPKSKNSNSMHHAVKYELFDIDRQHYLNMNKLYLFTLVIEML